MEGTLQHVALFTVLTLFQTYIFMRARISVEIHAATWPSKSHKLDLHVTTTDGHLQVVMAQVSGLTEIYSFSGDYLWVKPRGFGMCIVALIAPQFNF